MFVTKRYCTKFGITREWIIYLDERSHSIWTQQNEMLTQPIVRYFWLIQSVNIGLEVL